MRAQSIVFAALEKESPAQRASYLDEACRSDPDLRRRVEEVLRNFGAPAPSSTALWPESPTRKQPPVAPGAWIGPYRLLEQLGEGGMGIVWRAEQEHPVRRQVALKVIKPGMDSASVTARLESEWQALARMDHPHIARVLDAGTTESGRPYFVMELVQGVPITHFCDQERLTPRQRLELFLPVCRAVQHAHTKGIIHRDLKPGNVLVARHDGAPVPKVIDFGIAKAAGPQLTQKALFTEVGSVVGTLDYMAPEQAELNNLDIDTRADVYSLGALLYELLTGGPPFTARQLRSVPLTEALRIIRETEPPRPSARLSSSAELPAISARHNREPHKLARLVRGELDWIVMRCLEKERPRRYETASALAADLQRYLADEPVLAGPPSAGYRVRKFLRRHRAGVLTAAALAALLLVGLAVSISLAVWAINAEGIAWHSQRQEADQRRRAESNLYLSRIAQARLEWRLNDVAAAERVLDLCPQQSRGWEWRYLKGLNHADLLTLDGLRRDLISGVAYSPDGERLATASGDLFAPAGVLDRGAVQVWDANTGQLLRTWKTGVEPTCVAFSPDGRRVAANARDSSGNVVQIWDVATGREIATLQSLRKGPWTLAFSPDGHRLAVAQGRIVLLYDAATGQEVQSPLKHKRLLNHVAFSPDGNYLASAGDNGVRLWNAVTGEEVHYSTFPCSGVAFSPDGKLLASASGPVTRVWEVATGRLIHTLLEEGRVSRVAFSPDGRHLASAGKDTTVRLRDVRTGEERLVLRGHTGRVRCLSFHPSGRYLVSGSEQPGQVKVWDLTRPQEHALFQSPSVLTTEALAFAADSRRLLTLSAGGTLLVRDVPTASGLTQRHIPMRDLPMTGQLQTPARIAAFSPDGRRFAAVDSADRRLVRLGEVAGSTEPQTLPGHSGEVNQVAFSGDGRRLATAGLAHDREDRPGRRDILVWDVLTRRKLAAFHLQGPPAGRPYSALALSPDGTLLAGAEYPEGTDAARVKVWEVESQRERATLAGLQEGAVSLAFSPDGRSLAAADGYRGVLLWDVAGGQPLLDEPLKGALRLDDLAYSPDGRLLAGATLEQVHVWEVVSGQEVLLLRGAPRRPRPVGFNPRIAWSPDGRFLASANWDNTVSVWGTANPDQARAERQQTAGQRAFGWHLQAARHSLKAADRFALTFHHQRLAGLEPPTAWMRLGRGDLHGLVGRWDEARRDYAAALAAEPGLETPRVGRRFAALCLRTGDIDAYRRVCERLEASWGRADDADTIHHVCRPWTWGRHGRQDCARLVPRAQRMVDLVPGNAWAWNLLGAARYRAGQWQEVVRALGRSLELPRDDPACLPCTWLYLAMAHCQLGQREEGLRYLQKAQAALDEAETRRAKTGAFNQNPQQMWSHWLEALHLRAEAEALLQNATGKAML